MPEEGFLGRLYKDGETVMEEGTESRTMYIIQCGKVKVVKSDEGRETVLALLAAGDIFGEMSLFDASPRSATVKVVGEARILAIEHEGLLKKIKMDPTLAFRIIKQMSQRIRNLNSRLSSAQKTINHVHDKLVQLDEAEDVGIKNLEITLSSILRELVMIPSSVPNHVKDIETKLSSVLNSAARIRRELHQLNEMLDHVAEPLH